jgi:hypothetical protein
VEGKVKTVAKHNASRDAKMGEAKGKDKDEADDFSDWEDSATGRARGVDVETTESESAAGAALVVEVLDDAGNS